MIAIRPVSDLQNKLTEIEEIDTWADQSGEEIITEMADFPEVIGHTKPEIASFRDNLIINVLKMHDRM